MIFYNVSEEIGTEMTVIVEDTGTGIMIVVGDPRVPDIDVEAEATPPSPDTGILTIINFYVSMLTLN